MSGETEREVSGWTVDTSRQDLNYRIESNRQIARERFGFVAVIGVVVWFEIQRRLENLNHEASRIQAVQAGSISSDTYSANEEQRKDERDKLDEWRKVVDIDRAKSITRDELNQTIKVDARQQKSDRLDVSKVWIAVGSLAVAFVFGMAGFLIARQQTPSAPVVVTPTVTAPK